MTLLQICIWRHSWELVESMGAGLVGGSRSLWLYLFLALSNLLLLYGHLEVCSWAQSHVAIHEALPSLRVLKQYPSNPEPKKTSLLFSHMTSWGWRLSYSMYILILKWAFGICILACFSMVNSTHFHASSSLQCLGGLLCPVRQEGLVAGQTCLPLSDDGVDAWTSCLCLAFSLFSWATFSKSLSPTSRDASKSSLTLVLARFSSPLLYLISRIFQLLCSPYAQWPQSKTNKPLRNFFCWISLLLL